jgi:hypothetical protein
MCETLCNAFCYCCPTQICELEKDFVCCRITLCQRDLGVAMQRCYCCDYQDNKDGTYWGMTCCGPFEEEVECCYLCRISAEGCADTYNRLVKQGWCCNPTFECTCCWYSCNCCCCCTERAPTCRPGNICRDLVELICCIRKSKRIKPGYTRV